MPSKKTDPRAEDLTPTRRPPRDVLGDAIDLYLRAPSHEKSEIRAFAALVDGLLDGASAIERRRIALALAPRADTPPEIARRLATDSIEIAEQMIERSPVLTSTDLVEIMRCGPAHVGCVGRRLDLAPDVAAVLIDNAVARPESLPAVAGTRRRTDRAAAIPPAPAVADAVPTPTTAPDLPPPLFRVPVRETPPAGAEATTATTPPAETPRAPARLPSGLAFVALDTAARWRALQAAALDAASRTAPTRDPAMDADFLGERLLAALIADDRDFFARALRDHLGLDDSLLQAVLDEPSGEVLAILLVAAGIGETRATTILLHHLGEAATLGRLQDLVALIERTARRTAERLVGGWRGTTSRHAMPLRQIDPADRREPAGAARGTTRTETSQTTTARRGG